MFKNYVIIIEIIYTPTFTFILGEIILSSGIMIENGEFAYPVNEVTIANNLIDMFKNIIPLNDLEFKTSTNSPNKKQLPLSNNSTGQ